MRSGQGCNQANLLGNGLSDGIHIRSDDVLCSWFCLQASRGSFKCIKMFLKCFPVVAQEMHELA